MRCDEVAAVGLRRIAIDDLAALDRRTQMVLRGHDLLDVAIAERRLQERHHLCGASAVAALRHLLDRLEQGLEILLAHHFAFRRRLRIRVRRVGGERLQIALQRLLVLL